LFSRGRETVFFRGATGGYGFEMFGLVVDFSVGIAGAELVLKVATDSWNVVPVEVMPGLRRGGKGRLLVFSSVDCD